MSVKKLEILRQVIKKVIESTPVIFIRQDIALMKIYYQYKFKQSSYSNNLIIDISSSNTTISSVRYNENGFVINLVYSVPK